jgi:hypothetical protein
MEEEEGGKECHAMPCHANQRVETKGKKREKRRIKGG